MSPLEPQLATIYWTRTIVLGLVALLIVHFLSTRRKSVAIAAAILFTVFADLRFIDMRAMPTMPASYASAPPAAEGLDPRSGRILHVAAMEFLDDRTPLSQGYFQWMGWWMHRNAMLPRAYTTWGFEGILDWDTEHTALLPSADLMESLIEVKYQGGRSDWAEIFASMSNVAYMSRFEEPDRAAIGSGAAASGYSPVRFFPTGPHPRYYFADRMQTIGSREDFSRRIAAGEWRGRPAFVFGPGFEPAPGRVNRVEEGPHWARLSVTAEGDGFLVASVTPHKYWAATVDGNPVPLETVNVGFQGLRVPGGEHVIEMRYRNPLVIVGAWISAVALLGLLAGLVFAVARRRRGDSAESASPPVAAGGSRPGAVSP